MDDVFVARLMSSTVHTVTPPTLVEEAAQHMLDNDIGSVVVVDEDNAVEGILTTTDFVRIVAERRPKDQTAVARYMTTDVVTASANDTVREVASTMIDHGFHHMPVVSETEGVIGMITTTDLAAYLSYVDVPDAV